MAVSHEQKLDPERGVYYEITLSANGDVAQAALIPGDLKGKLDWLNGKVSWHKGASVTATFTNAGPDAMAIAGGNGVLAGLGGPPGRWRDPGGGDPSNHGPALYGQRGCPDGPPLHRE